MNVDAAGSASITAVSACALASPALVAPPNLIAAPKAGVGALAAPKGDPPAPEAGALAAPKGDVPAAAVAAPKAAGGLGRLSFFPFDCPHLIPDRLSSLDT